MKTRLQKILCCGGAMHAFQSWDLCVDQSY